MRGEERTLLYIYVTPAWSYFWEGASGKVNKIGWGNKTSNINNIAPEILGGAYTGATICIEGSLVIRAVSESRTLIDWLIARPSPRRRRWTNSKHGQWTRGPTPTQRKETSKQNNRNVCSKRLPHYIFLISKSTRYYLVYLICLVLQRERVHATSYHTSYSISTRIHYT